MKYKIIALITMFVGGMLVGSDIRVVASTPWDSVIYAVSVGIGFMLFGIGLAIAIKGDF